MILEGNFYYCVCVCVGARACVRSYKIIVTTQIKTAKTFKSVLLGLNKNIYKLRASLVPNCGSLL